MKKWWLILVAGAVACSGIALVLGRPAQVPVVATYTLQPTSVEQTVSCSGVIESAKSTGVYAETVCVLGEVPVQAGQAVQAGERLATVDKEATQQAGLADNRVAALALAAMPEELVAPQDGILVAVNGQDGQVLGQDVPCAVVAPLLSIRARIAIREKDLPALRVGMPVRLSGDGFEKSTYTGTLTDISSSARVNGNETVVEGVVEFSEGQVDTSLRLGLTAKASVVISSVEDGLVIPYDAVRTDEKGREYVYVLENGIATRRMPKVETELAEGLLLADRALVGAVIVTQPDLVTADGVAVQAAPEVGR